MHNKAALKVGIASFLMIVSIASLLIWKSSIFLRATGYEVTGEFTGIAGLLGGAEVRYRGYKVGRVSEILPGPKSVIVHFWVEPEVKIPKGSTLKVLFDGLIGERYIAIQSNPNSDVLIEPGDVLSGYSTAGLADFVDEGTQTLEHAKEIVASIQKIVTSPEVSDSIRNIVLKLDKITSDLAVMTDASKAADLKGTLTQVNGMIAELNGFAKNLNGLSADAKNRGLVEKVDSILSNLEKLSGELSGSSGVGTGNAIESNALINSRLDLQYWTQPKETTVLGSVDLNMKKKFLRLGVGNRLGSLEVLNVQGGMHVNRDLTARAGMIMTQPGVGLDYQPVSNLGFSVDVYNLSQVQADFTTRLSLTKSMDLAATLAKDTTGTAYSNWGLGVQVRP